MTTVSILTIPGENGGVSYQAVAGDRRSDGRTPGEALDAIASQFTDEEASILVVLQKSLPDQFFTKQQRDRLEVLMCQWRSARDRGAALSDERQVELDTLIQTELWAAGERAKAMADSLRK